MEFGATEDASFVKDYGLDSVIPNDDIIQAAAGGTNYNPVNHTTEVLTDLILLDREKRVADIVFDENNYNSGYKIDVAVPVTYCCGDCRCYSKRRRPRHSCAQSQ